MTDYTAYWGRLIEWWNSVTSAYKMQDKSKDILGDIVSKRISIRVRIRKNKSWKPLWWGREISMKIKKKKMVFGS